MNWWSTDFNKHIEIIQWGENTVVPWNGLNCSDQLIHRFFFNKYAVSSLYPQVSHLWIQPTADEKHYFRSAAGNLWMWRTSCTCMHRPTPLYIQDFSILDFGIHVCACVSVCMFVWGVLEPIPCGYWGTTEVSEESKVIHEFLTVPLTTTLFKGQ